MSYAPLPTVAERWFDLTTAAQHAGVTYGELVDAVTSRHLRTTTTLPQRLGDWMVPMVDVDRWSGDRRLAGAGATS